MTSLVRLTKVGLRSDADVPHVRQVAKATAESLGFSEFQQTRILTAVIEVARNAIVHGGGGHAVVSLGDRAGRAILDVAVSDQGSGMSAGQKADVYADRVRPSERGLGLGLRGARRMADDFQIDSGPHGTDVRLGFASPATASELRSLAIKIGERLASLKAVDPATTLAQQNHELLAAIAERDLLIQEVHHRTRNNIALIRSMVRLTEHAATHPETKVALAELSVRMQAVSSVHEQLERAETGQLVQILPFLESVANSTYDAFSAPERTIAIDVCGADLTISSSAAVDVGLIVAELITNALKHAFSNRTTGRLSVRAIEADREAGTFILEVADDGPGLPAGQARPERSKSLGWRMIRAMAARHDGEVSTQNDNGLKVTITLRADI